MRKSFFHSLEPQGAAVATPHSLILKSWSVNLIIILTQYNGKVNPGRIISLRRLSRSHEGTHSVVIDTKSERWPLKRISRAANDGD